MPTYRYTVVDGELIAQQKDGVRSVFVPDANGSAVAILSAGAVVDELDYWPSGAIRSRSGSTETNFLFGGVSGAYQCPDDLVYNRTGYLSTTNARWLAPDVRTAVSSGTYAILLNAALATPVGKGDPDKFPYATKESCGDNTDLVNDIVDSVCTMITSRGRDGLAGKCEIGPKEGNCLFDWCQEGKIECAKGKDLAKICPANAAQAGGSPDGSEHKQNPKGRVVLCPGVFPAQIARDSAGKCATPIGNTILHEMEGTCGRPHGPDDTKDKCEQMAQCICAVFGAV